MNGLPAFKQKLAKVSRLWAAKDHDAALAEVERLLIAWPGNPHLYVLWATFVQLQERPTHKLDEIKHALQHAFELDNSSPAAAIELGHFLDAVDDDPLAAAKVYSDAVASARQLLVDGLIGHAKALVQLDKRDDALRCVMEVLALTQNEPGHKRGKSNGTAQVGSRAAPGRGRTAPLNGALTAQIEEIIGQVLTNRSA